MMRVVECPEDWTIFPEDDELTLSHSVALLRNVSLEERQEKYRAGNLKG